ncbi:uncharacterized protein LOC123550186 isoform X2 [Mercenaria mercenaria]|uniref:uncharacterized protein LOC123550186 isoform X2 n=1 Tax=Mercenaria mercenaria TaxID=6596 RepID=UPI00234EE75D|nr:uncharacterized protein LOC123550186 isoform X2 [Mercenaria mercenaria]
MWLQVSKSTSVCSVMHRSPQSIYAINYIFETSIQEIMFTFLKHCHQNSSSTSITSFYTYIQISEDKNFRFMCDVTINYVLPIIVYRAGVRRNNFKYISAGKAQFLKLFFAFGMKNYQELLIKDIQMYVLAPPEVKDFLEKTQSFTVSGHPSKGEGGDFVLEAINGKIKRWLPPGIPEEKHWQEVCRNADLLEKIRDNTFKCCNIKEENASSVYKRDMSEEVVQYRIRIRKIGYLSNTRFQENPHTAVTGEFLDKTLHLYERQMEDNVQFICVIERTLISPLSLRLRLRDRLFTLLKEKQRNS